MTARQQVTLRGGPFDGAVVEVEWGTTLTCEGHPIDNGQCARYRPSRDPGVYTFRGMSTIIARLPLPGEKAAA